MDDDPIDPGGGAVAARIERALSGPGFDALVLGERRLASGELEERSRSFAGMLVRLGFRPGERVAIWNRAGLTPEGVVAAVGALRAGAGVVELPASESPERVRTALRASGARLLVAPCEEGEKPLAHLKQAVPECFKGEPGATHAPDVPALRYVVVSGESVPDGAYAFSALLGMGLRTPPEALRSRRERGAPVEDTWIRFVATGSAGVQGHVFADRALDAGVSVAAAAVGLGPGDPLAVIAPGPSALGDFVGVLVALVGGSTFVGPAPVLPAEVLERVAAERVAVLAGSPSDLRSLLAVPGRARWDLGALRSLAVLGDPPLAAEVARIAVGPEGLACEAVALLGRAACWGPVAISTSAATAGPGPEASMPAPGEDRVAGRPVAGVEVRTDGGGLWFRGEATAQDLLRDEVDPGAGTEDVDEERSGDEDAAPARVEAVSGPDVAPGPGWWPLSPGGRLDERGRLVLGAEEQARIVVGGVDVDPRAIEALYGAHPDLAAVAAVGVPDDRMGQVVMLFVVPGPGARPDPAALARFAQGQLEPNLLPRYVEIVEALPRREGRVDRAGLRRSAIERYGLVVPGVG